MLAAAFDVIDGVDGPEIWVVHSAGQRALRSRIAPRWSVDRSRWLAVLSLLGEADGLVVDSDTERREELAATLQARDELAHLDMEHVVGPILDVLPQPAILFYPARLSSASGGELSVRRCLQRSLAQGWIGEDRYGAVTGWPLWAGADLHELMRRCELASLPRPCGGDLDVGWCVTSRQASASGSTFAQANFALAEGLRRSVHDAGGRWWDCRRAGDLLGLLGVGGGGRALLVIAHQEEGGIQLEEEALPLRHMREVLPKVPPERRHGTVVLAICRSSRRGNLADIFQEHGALSVVSYGERVVLAEVCLTWTHLLRGGALSGHVPLCVAIDRAWLATLRAAK